MAGDNLKRILVAGILQAAGNRTETVGSKGGQLCDVATHVDHPVIDRPVWERTGRHTVCVDVVCN